MLVPFIKDQIKELVSEAVKSVFGESEVAIKIEYPGEMSHGDYAAPVGFELAKKLKTNPREAAQKIMDALKVPAWIEKVEIAGAGFLNFYIKPEFLTHYLHEILDAGETFGTSKIGHGKTVITDTSNPNVAKPMGVHHLLSTIIGNALNKMFSATGYKLIRDNYIGDWGTQFGKLIYAYRTWGSEETVKKDPIPELLKLYVKFHEEVELKPELDDMGRLEFKKLENGDEENRTLWRWFVDLSLQEFEKTWGRLDVSFDVINGESFYENKMQAIIDLGVKKGIFVEGEKGSLIAPFTHEKYPPCIIRKSDGATLYATRDLARIQYWEETWHPDLMIVVADTAQQMHFMQLYEVVDMLGITDAENVHVWFGRMSFPEKKMSTRKGNIILMEELLDEAEDQAYKIVCEKNAELEESRKKEVARQVGIGAVKYAILAQNRTTDVTFTWEKMLSLDGNSAPYIQYSYARARSVLRKGDMERVKGKKHEFILKEPQETLLARLLPRFPEVLIHATEEYKPNLLTNYLFEVASAFNTFYGAVNVLQSEPAGRLMRLDLVEATSVVLKNGLALLGIECPEEM